MRNRKLLLAVLLSVASVFTPIIPVSAAVSLPDYSTIDHAVKALNMHEGNFTPMVAAGDTHTVGLRIDGTVIAAGDNNDGQCNVGDWADMVQIAAGYAHTVGLKTDATVVAVGRNIEGQCDVRGWTGIVQVAAGGFNTLGLKADGTVVAVGLNRQGQCDVGNWTDIVQVAASGANTFGLTTDGTVVATGCNIPYQCDVSDWTNIVQVAAGDYHAVGLMPNGTVVPTHFMMRSDFAKWNLLLPAPLMNWPLIGGIVATVMAVGLAIFLVRRKRRG